MPIEDNGKDIEGKPSGKTSGAPPPPTDPNANSNESSAEKLEKDIKRGEWWLIRIGIATLLMNTVIAVIYWGQLKEMKKATKLTGDAVKVARDTLTETQTSNTWQAFLADQARQDANAASDASRKDTAKSLQATIDNFHQEQRAWVGLTTLGIVGGTLAKGNTVSAIVTFSNLGRTPAQRCYMQTGDNLLTPDQALVIDYSSLKGTKPNWTTVPPGAHPNGVTEKLKDTNGGIAILDEPEIAKLKSGEHLFYVFGRIFYNDTFGAKHHTFFCGVMNPDLTTFQNCHNSYHDEN